MLLSDEIVKRICQEIPKAENHLHIEGSLEPSFAFELAKRNKIKIPFSSVEEIESKFNFKDKKEFMDIYFQTVNLLITEKDFEDLMFIYLTNAQKDNVKYSEVFIAPQFFMDNGIEFVTIINGLIKGIKKGKEVLNIESKLIVSILRHLSETSAIQMISEIEKNKDLIGTFIIAVGMDSYEEGNPPEKFKNAFQKARQLGLKLTSHAEEGPVKNIKTLIDELYADRIDHGFKVFEDKSLLKRCVDAQVPFTLCPISNYKVKFDSILTNQKMLRTFLDEGLVFSINSDDPGFFRDYIADNYYELYKKGNLTLEDLFKIAKNSFKSCFIDEKMKQNYISLIDDYIEFIDIKLLLNNDKSN